MNNINHKKPKGAGRNSFELIDPKKLLKIIPLKAGYVVLDLAFGKGGAIQKSDKI